ncbi:MAG: hypothetical protein WBF36_10055 [Desulfobulbales bacterium]
MYLLLAIIFVAIYIGHFLPGLKNSKLRKILEVETILMVVLIFVAVIAARVEKVSSKMDMQANYFSEIIDDALRDEGLAKIQEFDSASDLYNELIAARKRSTEKIRLGRLRAMSADDLLYKNIEEWLDAAPGRVLYRVVNVTGEGMESWFDEECTRRRGTNNLGLKKIEGKRDVPNMNFAVFDDSEVFLMAHPQSDSPPLSVPFEATKAIHIKDPAVATYMATYFDQIFEVATGCSSTDRP